MFGKLRLIASQRIRSAAIAAGLAGSIAITCFSYSLNSVYSFYDGLVGIFAILWLGKIQWRKAAAFNLAANTGILLIIGLPLADGVFAFIRHRAMETLLPPLVEERIYSYEVAKGNPDQFAVWWNRFLREWDEVSESIVVKAADRRLPYRLKPGSTGTFFDSDIRINKYGFRDREFALEKGDQYRIVAIGESTTMGLTLRPEGRPWPKVLDRLINENCDSAQPIEVLNAGVAGYTLRDNLIRLKKRVLPLNPDMIISYHGYNGFPFLDDTLEPEERLDIDAEPPRRMKRPSALLEEAEHRLKMHRFRSRHFHRNLSNELFERRKRRLRDSQYSEFYRELISVARRRGIKLVLVTFSMAVNEESPSDVVNFYRGGFIDVAYRIQANRLQTCLLEELGRQNDDLLVVSTKNGLDGRHELFYDLMHLTQTGKNTLAEIIFAKLKDSFEDDELIQISPEGAVRNRDSGA